MRFQDHALVRWPLSGTSGYSTAWSRAHYVEVVKGQLSPTTVCHVEVNPEWKSAWNVQPEDVCRNCLWGRPSVTGGPR